MSRAPISRVLIIGSHTPISREIGHALTAASLPMAYAAGPADALKRLRAKRFDVVITSADSDIDENLALLEEMRSIRSGLKCIVLAHKSTPEKVINALKARVFGCFTPPFDTHEIATLAASAASDSNESHNDIEILSARPGWVSIRAHCRLVTAERLLSFAKELSAQLPEDARQEIIQAFREILMNAMEHGAKFNPEQVVEVNAIRTARSMVFRIRDPGTGFQKESLSHAAIGNPATDPTAHILLRKEQGMRAGGYGLLLASGTVDELIYNATGNEVILIKYLDTTVHNEKP
jgi:anti-sigma regulatory factor (Ser/Thr protein kinase)/DNA-binding NarL/FixJ family response regulator